MNKKTWTIFGAGDFIDDIFDAVEANNGRVTKIVFNQKLKSEVKKSLSRRKIKVIPLVKFQPESDNYFFGFVDPNKKPLLKQLKKFKIKFSNLIHPFSYISPTAKMGQGNFVGAGGVVASTVKIGDFNIINRVASVGHHVTIKSFNHIGPGATISGRCRIGSNNFFGAGSTLIDGKTIRNNITIGAGSVVISNLRESGTYIGVPAKIHN